MHENRETSSLAASSRGSPAGEGQGHTSGVNGGEESDCPVVPVSWPNKAERSVAEVGEGRGRAKENASLFRTLSTQGEVGVTPG
jgi:hypothetical protein